MDMDMEEIKDIMREMAGEPQLISKEKRGKLKGTFTFNSKTGTYINERGESLTTEKEQEDLKKYLGKEYFQILKKFEAWELKQADNEKKKKKKDLGKEYFKLLKKFEAWELAQADN